MKPVAPTLPAAADKDDHPSLQSELGRLCEAKASDERVTIPAPPTEEALRAATPFPPPRDPERRDTTPASPPSSIRRRTDSEPESEAVPSTIPGPPRVPRIAGM
jgi:hypothetical protein